MFWKLIFSLLLLSSATNTYVQAQAAPAAVKTGGLQVGIGYVRANPDYSPMKFNGFVLYGDADLWKHFGAEAEFHRISTNNTVSISEMSYEAGARYRYPVWRFSPYLKILGGAGTFSFGDRTQNGTYAMYAGGGGVDFRISPKFSVRADYEYQRWGNFPPRGLQPSLASAGVSYTFR